MTNVNDHSSEQRPLIILTAADRDKLAALVQTSPENESDVVRFLREEIDRAEVVQDGPGATSLVTMNAKAKFIDHQFLRVLECRLVYPDEAHLEGCISILTPIGTALIGLGPGQSIGWLEDGIERRLTVVEVGGNR